MWPVALAQVLLCPSTDFSFQNPGFWEFIWTFSRRNHFKINISHILNPNLTKQIPLNHAHRDLSNNTKCTFQFLQKFKLWFNLIFSEEIIQYSRTFALQGQLSWNYAHAPLLIESFPKTPRTWSEASWLGGSHNYKTKQTKLPSSIDGCDNRGQFFSQESLCTVSFLLLPGCEISQKTNHWSWHQREVITFFKFP